MAIMIPESINQMENVTSGEVRFFDLLKKLLPEDYIVWYELEVTRKTSDFIILGPDIGILVIEVKDWNINSIVKADNNHYELSTAIGTTLNPQKQARTYMMNILNRLKTVSELQKKDAKYKGKPVFTYGCGVVFSKIAKKSFESRELDGTVEMKNVMFQDDLKRFEDGEDSEGFLKMLRDMIPYRFKPLTKEQVDLIRGNLYKESRLIGDDDVFKVMDYKQEQMAKSLGYGHRVIRGVAGSGKTLVLTCRAQYLARNHKDWKILVLCFNNVLASHLRNVINAERYENLETKNFHQIVSELSVQFGIKHGIRDKEVTRILQEIKNNHLDDVEKYDAILIDEGQDLSQDWIEFIVCMLRNPQESHIVLASDGAQNLYNRKYTLKSVGIKATGRTKILKSNYRNTKEILDFANEFIIDDEIDKSSDEEDNNFFIESDRALRSGSKPVVKICNSFEDEVERIVGEIEDLKAKGHSLKDVCILYHNKTQLPVIESSLKKNNIDYYAVSKSSHSKKNFKYNHEGVKVSTIHSSKGLDFENVFITGLNPSLEKRYNESKKLLYVAMTRAKSNLIITCNKMLNDRITKNIISISNGENQTEFKKVANSDIVHTPPTPERVKVLEVSKPKKANQPKKEKGFFESLFGIFK